MTNTNDYEILILGIDNVFWCEIYESKQVLLGSKTVTEKHLIYNTKDYEMGGMAIDEAHKWLSEKLSTPLR